MKLPNNLGLKVYLILFSIFALGDITALMLPDGATYIYYNTLLRFQHTAIIWYLGAILNAILGCLAIIPMYLRAFGKRPVCIQLFQMLFVLRIVTIFLGHNYESVVLKSAFIGTPVMGFLTLGIWSLFSFPSFKEHYIYAFQSKQ